MHAHVQCVYMYMYLQYVGFILTFTKDLLCHRMYFRYIQEGLKIYALVFPLLDTVLIFNCARIERSFSLSVSLFPVNKHEKTHL